MTRTVSLSAPAEAAGMEIRAYLRRELGISARVLADLKYRGSILKNGVPARSTELLHAGDALTLTIWESVEEYEPAGVMPPILYEDEDFLALDKPQGMPVHPTPGHDRDSVLNAAAEYCRAGGFPFRPLYRLDRDTTGVLLLAKNRFASGAVLQKTYMAVCEGVLPPEGRIELPIGLFPGHTIQRATGIGAPAVTNYKCLKTDGTHSLAIFHLGTGRTHQIRVHMSAIGHPVAGDDLYGGSREKIPAQMLLCSEVCVASKVLQKAFTVRASFSDAQKNAFPDLFSETEEPAEPFVR